MAKKKAAPAQLVSEHGRGGGTGGNDVGVVPTPANVQKAYGVPPSVLDTTPAAAPPAAGAGDDHPDAGDQSQQAAPAPAPIDWSALLGEYGLPQDVIDHLNEIWSAANGDVNGAVTLALAYIRGTDWYAQTYPGIQSGINAGLFSDEQGYRGYQNQIDQIYQQYYGRAATSAEVAGYAKTGEAASHVGQMLQAQAIYGNLSDPLKALFTPDELRAFANEQAGIDSQLGQKITSEANLYTGVNLLYQNFFGRSVSRGELDQLTTNGTDPQHVAQQFATAENLDAISPTVKALFSTDELHQIALDAAGGTTQNGQQLTALSQLATQLNPVYSQYTGQGISRDELNQTYQSGQTVGQVTGHFAGQAYAAANGPDIQQAAGAFGDAGQLSAADLQTLGEEESGYDTPHGQMLLNAYNKAQQRLQGVFKGALASPAVANLGSLTQPRPTAPSTPDVGA